MTSSGQATVSASLYVGPSTGTAAPIPHPQLSRQRRRIPPVALSIIENGEVVWGDDGEDPPEDDNQDDDPDLARDIGGEG